MTTDVLLTRPEADNLSLARRLTERGLAVDSLPLIEIRPVDLTASRGIMTDLDLFEHIIFVSRNAVRHGLPALEDFWPQWPAHLNWFAVGEATASELRAAGIEPQVPDRENSEGLLDLEPLRQVDGNRVLIVRGRDGREVLAKGLEARGALITYLDVHERQPVRIDRGIREALAETPPLITVVYSAAILESMVENLGVLDTTLVLPSERIALKARDAGFASVIVAESANERDMAAAVLDARS